MAQHIYRVVVRGEFADLDPAVREALLAEVDAHDLTLSSYTAAGTFTYEPRLHAFSFRYEVRRIADDDTTESECAAAAASQGEALARAYLDERAITFKRLRSTTVNMADMWN